MNYKKLGKILNSKHLSLFILSNILISYQAAAACGTTTGQRGVISFTIPNEISIPRNAPVGSVVYKSPGEKSIPEIVFNCTGDIAGTVDGQKLNSTQYPISPNSNYGVRFIYGSGKLYNYGEEYLTNAYRSFTLPFRFDIIKIRSDGSDTFNIPAGNILGYYKAGNEHIHEFRIVNEVNFTSQTCTVSNINVPMGVQPASGFQGINTRMTPTAFAINLNNCPSGINSIKYRLDPTTTIINPTKSVVTLQSSSTASGVGVQILDASSNPLPLGVDNVFSGYAATGGNYSIPLKAAYYQTGYIAKGGSANTSLTFTMTYQ